MYKHLYDCFKHWWHGGMVYFYSDPHFADNEMKYIRHNYIGDEEQVARINTKIGKNDTIVFLGDIGDVSFISKIRGYKVHIMGNHDTGATNYQRKIVDGKDNHLFDEVYEGVLAISDKIILSHEPVNIPFMLNIHGHDHSKWQENNPQLLNVCAEHINYTPVSLKSIVESGALKSIESIHRMTIDRAVVRKKKRNSK